MESLVYSGAFDCFKDVHRAQYFYQLSGDVSAMDKITKFGAVFQSQAANATNTLFGDLQMPDIVPPKLLPCPPWSLVEQLDFEKEVTGMFMSGHPLDNFKFELTHYNITPLSEYNEIKNAMNVTPPSSRQMRLAGLVIDAQHRLTKNGKNFGILNMEDFSGKSEFMLWSEDYVKYNNYLEKGMIVMVEGAFRTRYNTDQYEFRLTRLHLLETVKSVLTKQVILELAPQFIDKNFVEFIDHNVKSFPGMTSLKFNISDTIRSTKICLSTLEKGFTMNDEMAVYLNDNKHIDVSVITA